MDARLVGYSGAGLPINNQQPKANLLAFGLLSIILITTLCKLTLC